MTKKVFNMEGGQHSAAAFTALENRMYGSMVATDESCVVSAGTGMNVNVSAGDGIIDTGEQFARRFQIDSQETVPVTAANASLPRLDVVVVYIDNSVTVNPEAIDNTNNVLKLACVAGTPAASPTEPTTSMVQSAIGAGNPYMKLSSVLVPQGATSLADATFTDLRKYVFPISSEQIGAGAIKSENIGENEVKSHNIDFTTLSGNYSAQEVNTGYKWVNGKSIYKKTVNFGSLPNADLKRVSHGIPVSTIERFIRIEAVASYLGNSGTQGISLPLPFIGNPITTNFVTINTENDGNIAIRASTDRSNATAFVTLFYTKV